MSRTHEITLIVVHCSDSPNGRPDTAEDIHAWHQERGWDGIGYHEIIEIDGAVKHGRPHYWTGAHVGGHNTDSIGVCLIGTDFFTNNQHTALEDIIHDLRDRHPHAAIRGHYELNSNKTCPNIDMPRWLKARGIDRK